MIRAGDKVRHPRMPGWGIGKVMAAPADGKARIFFVNVGEKVVLLEAAGVEKVEGETGYHPILDNPSLPELAKSKAHKGLPSALEDFLRHFPGGFEDATYLAKERNYKVAAGELLWALLNKQEFRALLKGDAFEEITRRALQVVNKTNLIYPNEKMGLKDGLAAPESKELFSRRLFGLLHGEASPRERFEGFADCLGKLGAAKWTTATYFQFLAFPSEHMFLKPKATQDAAALTKFELNYRPELNWLTYTRLLAFADFLEGGLVQLGMPPRDRIDIQSLMWCITLGK
jgi:hypothetical protein